VKRDWREWDGTVSGLGSGWGRQHVVCTHKNQLQSTRGAMWSLTSRLLQLRSAQCENATDLSLPLVSSSHCRREARNTLPCCHRPSHRKMARDPTALVCVKKRNCVDRTRVESRVAQEDVCWTVRQLRPRAIYWLCTKPPSGTSVNPAALNAERVTPRGRDHSRR
jgi:hypothetical protein